MTDELRGGMYKVISGRDADGDISSWAVANRDVISKFDAAAITAIDSSRKPSASIQLAATLGRNPDTQGGPLVISTDEFLRLVDAGDLNGFDEAWLAEARIPSLAPGPVRLDCSETVEEPSEELRAWMQQSVLTVGLGDGLGLNYVVAVTELANELRFVERDGLSVRALEFLDSLPPLVAAAAAGDESLVHALLRDGTSPDQADDGGWTALEAAASRCHAGCARLLVEAGADINVADNEGFTPLIMAASGGSPEIVDLLLERGAQVDVETHELGYTPLLRAAEHNHAEVARQLIRAGADPNQIRRGRTALMIAAEHGAADAVDVLLEAGADPSMRHDGRCADELAIEFGYDDIAARIRSHHG